MCSGSFAISTTEIPVVYLTFADMKTFVDWADGDTAIKEVVDGLGDAAYCGPSNADVPTALVFRKGTRSVRVVSTKKDDAGARLVSYEQLREIADLIESRM